MSTSGPMQLMDPLSFLLPPALDHTQLVSSHHKRYLAWNPTGLHSHSWTPDLHSFTGLCWIFFICSYNSVDLSYNYLTSLFINWLACLMRASSLEHKQGAHLFCSLLYLQHLDQYLAQNINSINTYILNVVVVIYLRSYLLLPFATPWTVAHQAPLSMDFPGKNTGVGCHFLL